MPLLEVMVRTKKRTVIIGLDGTSFSLLKDLSERGIMPNTRQLISQGIFKKMQSSVPEISSVAWSSIITGCNPAEHGIFGFTDFAPGTYRLCFPNFNNLQRPPFWTQIGGKSVIINIPSTYPVRELNGIHISGFISLDLERSVYPQSLVPKLKEMDYALDVDSEKASKSYDLFLNDLDKTLKARIKSYRYLWDSQDWQVFMLVFTGTDRLMHFLWDAYESETHKHNAAFLDHFRQIDDVIGEIADRIGDNDDFIMLSDHGFERLEKDVYVNHVLKKEGFLKLQDTPDATWRHIDYSTKAFALDPARIYINLKNKYPRGSVESRDKEKILKDLIILFDSLEIDGKKAIKDIHRKEEIYSGPLMNKAPDLVLVGNRNFNLKANIKADKLFSRGIFTGKHTQDDAFLLLRNNRSIVTESPTVADVVNVLNGG
ncbi:alkaline phosphatase family protein [Candidatus Omnitrophota bacterium]